MKEAKFSFGGYVLHIPGRSEPIPVKSVSAPVASETQAHEPSRLPEAIECEFDLTPECRREVMVFWIIASALATASRILD